MIEVVALDGDDTLWHSEQLFVDTQRSSPIRSDTTSPVLTSLVELPVCLAAMDA